MAARGWVRILLGSIALAAAGASAEVLIVQSQSGRTPRPPRDTTTTSSAPSPTAPSTTSTGPPVPPHLTTVAFFNPTDGYGLFPKNGTNGCEGLYVAKTTDGGAHFGPLLPLPGCEATALAFNDHGDGFAYGPDLYVSHDGGLTWTTQHEPGVVLSVEALGESIWALITECPPTTQTSKPCPFEVSEST